MKGSMHILGTRMVFVESYDGLIQLGYMKLLPDFTTSTTDGWNDYTRSFE